MTPERVKRIREVLDKRQPDLAIITDNVHKPHNISAIIRSCDAFAVPEMHVVWHGEQYRVFRGRTMGSHKFVSVKTHDNIVKGINQFKEKGYQVVAAHLSNTAIPHYEVDFTKPTAILMGAEKHGVSDEASAIVDQHITIPMEGMVESLNVSVAAALILSEACRQRSISKQIGNNKLDDTRYEQYFFEWCYPDLAKKCQLKNLPYPEIDENGDFLDPKAFSDLYNQS